LSELDKIDCAVIGAGVVGLAVARAMAAEGRDVIVLEAEDAIGTGTSSRNSEVIHAGIYYPKGSLKAELCVAGKNFLYEYCASHGVPHKACGKLIVATDEAQHETLAALQLKAADNGVDDITWIEGAEARAMEPALNATAALLSPSSGLIDSHALMLSYQGDAEANGMMLAFHAPVVGGAVTDAGLVIETGGPNPMNILCETVINCGGLFAQKTAALIRGLNAEHVPDCFYAKGNYFVLTGRAPFTHLIYPVPEEGGLGVHLTLDLAGQARFGPDVEWVDEIDYQVDPSRGDKFYDAVRTYWPGLTDGALAVGYSGIRPKLGGPGTPAADFVISGPADHGVQGLINLFGIESPGLTASLAIAQRVADSLK
jgi:L-2-hydroxyglutarate oxidase LhgO